VSVTVVVVWKGTRDEAFALARAVQHNCDCKPPTSCSAHRGMLDQRFIDHIVFYRRIAERLLAEEFRGESTKPIED
jgi:hypothetical protein